MGAEAQWGLGVISKHCPACGGLTPSESTQVHLLGCPLFVIPVGRLIASDTAVPIDKFIKRRRRRIAIIPPFGIFEAQL